MKKIKKIQFIFVICLMAIIFSNCETDPFGNNRFSLISNDELFKVARAQYDEEIKEYRRQGKIIDENTSDPILKAQYQLLQEVGANIKKAAEDWVSKDGNIKKLNGYFWEFNLVNDSTVNAWAMPGALIVFYTGILPVCQDDAGIAFVMGHEIAHALLNHTQRRLTTGQMIELTAALIGGIFDSDLAAIAVNLGLNLTVAPKYSQRNEIEADKMGQELMAIARYDPAQAPIMWGRMEALSGGGSDFLAFLSTHPTHATRISELTAGAPKAETFAKEKFYVFTFKEEKQIPGL